MYCKNCGSPLMGNDQFCKNCGASVITQNAQNNIEENQVNLAQNEFNNVQPQGYNNIGEQPVNNYQQPMNNYANNSNPIYNQPKKNSNNILILIGAIVAIIVVAVILIFALSGNKNNSTNNNNTSTNGGNPVVNNTSNYTVRFKGFTFKIPTNLVYETQTNSILIGDEEGTWSTSIEVAEGSYNQLLSNKNRIPGVYQQQGITASAAVEKNIGGVQYLTLEISKAGYNAILSFAKANSMYVFGTVTSTLDNEFNYDILKTIAPILSSAEFNNETNNMKPFEKIEISEISKLAQ